MMRVVPCVVTLACALSTSREVSAGITLGGVEYSCANGAAATMSGDFTLDDCSCSDGSKCLATKVRRPVPSSTVPTAALFLP